MPFGSAEAPGRAHPADRKGVSHRPTALHYGKSGVRDNKSRQETVTYRARGGLRRRCATDP
jgi:hypothetical protein